MFESTVFELTVPDLYQHLVMVSWTNRCKCEEKKPVMTISAIQSRIFFHFLSKKYFCLKKYEIFHLYVTFRKKSKWVGNRDYRVTKLWVQNLDPAVRACVCVCVCVSVCTCVCVESQIGEVLECTTALVLIYSVFCRLSQFDWSIWKWINARTRLLISKSPPKILNSPPISNSPPN